jgi:hypothetical protein
MYLYYLFKLYVRLGISLEDLHILRSIYKFGSLEYMGTCTWTPAPGAPGHVSDHVILV